jgi:hypothetical protein
MRAFVVAGPEDMVSDRDLTQGDDTPGQRGQGREGKAEGQGGRPRREAKEGGQRGRPAREARVAGRETVSRWEPHRRGRSRMLPAKSPELHSQMACQPRRQQPTVSWPTPVRLRRRLPPGDGRPGQAHPHGARRGRERGRQLFFWGCSSLVGPAIAAALLFSGNGFRGARRTKNSLGLS